MTPELQLILGCLLLSLIVAYAWWTKLRVLYFQLDMLKIVRDVQVASQASDSNAHPMSVLTIGIAEMLIQHTDVLSISVLRRLSAVTSSTSSDEASESLHVDESFRPFLKMILDRNDWPKEVESAIARMIFRVFVYVLFETFSGWIYSLILLTFGQWKTASDRIGRAIRMIPSADELRWLGTFLSTRQA